MDDIEFIEESDDPEFTEPAFYVVDVNGIKAGPFDDAGEAMWWQDKDKRV